MTRDAIHTTGAPAAVGPYSQAIAVDGFVFCSGQAALDPVTGVLAEGGIEAETEVVLSNLTAVLEAAGCGWGDVVKSTVFLTDMADFAAMNAIYARFVVGAEARPLDRRGRRPAEGRLRRDRGHRATAGLSGVSVRRAAHRPPRLTPRTDRPYDAAPT